MMPRAGATFENLGEQTEAKRLVLRQQVDNSLARADDSLIQVKAFPVREEYIKHGDCNELNDTWVKLGVNYGIHYSKRGSDPSGVLILRYEGKRISYFRPGDSLIGNFPDMDVTYQELFQFPYRKSAVAAPTHPTIARLLVLNTPEAKYLEGQTPDSAHEALIHGDLAFTDGGNGTWSTATSISGRLGLKRLRVILKTDITSATVLLNTSPVNRYKDASTVVTALNGLNYSDGIDLPNRGAFHTGAVSNYVFTIDLRGFAQFSLVLANITGGAVGNTTASIWAIE